MSPKVTTRARRGTTTFRSRYRPSDTIDVDLDRPPPDDSRRPRQPSPQTVRRAPREPPAEAAGICGIKHPCHADSARRARHLPQGPLAGRTGRIVAREALVVPAYET